jgi:hypothetical protein
LLSLTKAQLELFIKTSMLGDGSKKGGQVIRVAAAVQLLSRRTRLAVEAFAFALILSGRDVSLTTRGTPAQRDEPGSTTT